MGKITLQMIWDQNQDHTVKSDLKIKIKIKITSVISNQNHIFARKIRSKSRSLFSSPPAPNFFLSLIFSCLKFSSTNFFSDQTFSYQSEIHTFYPLQFHLLSFSKYFTTFTAKLTFLSTTFHIQFYMIYTYYKVISRSKSLKIRF